MKDSPSQRYSIIDITKAIGIISIIIGHSVRSLPLTGIRLGVFVYLYHLMVFFFCSGFCFDEKKYRANGHVILCGKKVITTGWLFFKYNLLFVIFHNILFALHFIPASPYSIREMMIHAANGLVFQTGESMLGAFWFLFVYLLAIVVFTGVFFVSERTVHNFALGMSGIANKNETRIKPSFVFNVMMVMIMALFALIGLYYNAKEIYLSFHIQTAFLAIPVIYIGWMAQKHFSTIERFLGLPSLIISAVLLYCCAENSIQIELSVNRLGKWYLFYPISITGIIFCLSLAKIIMKWRFGSKVMSFIGKRTFHYMALHFLIFKLTDNIIGRIQNDSFELITKFPTSYNIGLAYTVVAVAVISMILLLYDRTIKKRIHTIRKQNELERG